jgi:hypothetical protein
MANEEQESLINMTELAALQSAVRQMEAAAN